MSVWCKQHVEVKQVILLSCENHKPDRINAADRYAVPTQFYMETVA